MEQEKNKIEYHRHSCPNCGNFVGNKRIYLKAWLWAQWKCEHCGTKLCFSKKRRFLMAFPIVIIFLMTSVVEICILNVQQKAGFCCYIPFSAYQEFLLIPLTALFILVALAAMFVFSFDKIEIKK